MLPYWTGSPQPHKAFHLSGYAQGTSYHITYYATDSLVTGGDINRVLIEIDSSLSVYKPYSRICQFNRAATGIIMDKHFKNVLTKSLEIYKKTEGMADATVMPLVQAWGFGVTPVKQLPDSATIQLLLKCVGSDKLYVKNNTLYKTKPCVNLDFNGIAQGYSVDVIAELLEHKSILNYIVELGGEIRVKGKKRPSAEPIKIGIEAPNDQDFQRSTLQKVLIADSGGITTSGNYRKYVKMGTKQISHLIDPHSGYPVSNELVSVTVWAKDAITADGYDNALMGFGLKKGLDFINKEGSLQAYFIYHDASGKLRDTASAGFYQHFEKINSNLHE
jgi:thiamine biosynthesis lipoprotein